MFGFGKKKDKPVMPALFEGQITCDGQGYNSWKKPGAQRQTLLNLTKHRKLEPRMSNKKAPQG